MNWYYESEGKPQGPVSENLLRQLAREGKISLHTLVWSKGMPDWKPLSEAFEPPSPSDTSDSNQPATPPLAESEPQEQRQTHTSEEPAWEFSDSPWWRALPDTVSSLFLHPTRTFGGLAAGGNWSRPLSFFVLSSLIASVSFSLLFRIAPPQSLQALIAQWIPQLTPPGALFPAQPPEIPAGIMIGLGAFFTVLLAPIEAFISSAILHGLLWISGGARRGWSTSFRVVCYGAGAGKVLTLLQLIAVAAASLARNPSLTAAASLSAQGLVSLAGFSLLVLGMARAHHIALWRSILALFVLPTGGTILLIWLFARWMLPH
jgi:hypothetical protein